MVSRAAVNILFLKHNSETVGNILIVLCRIIEQVNADYTCKNDNSSCLCFLITSFLDLISRLYLSNHLKYCNATF